MPAVEITTSEQDVAFDEDGYATVSRTFRVWGVDPKVIFTNPASVPFKSGLGTLPDFGHRIATVVGNGPNGTSDGVQTSVVLYKYTCSPISSVIFAATAHYSNDQRNVPLASGFSSHAQTTQVSIPYIRTMVVVSRGSSSSATPTFIESSFAFPMPTCRYTQTVAIKRRDRAAAVGVASTEVGNLHLIPDVGWSRFEGMDIRSRGPQWLDVQYNWEWEEGVFDIEHAARSFDATNGDTINLSSTAFLFPQKQRPLNDALGESEMILPPYHTIETVYQVQGLPIKPVFLYRLRNKISSSGIGSLVGSDRFEWTLVP